MNKKSSSATFDGWIGTPKILMQGRFNWNLYYIQQSPTRMSGQAEHQDKQLNLNN